MPIIVNHQSGLGNFLGGLSDQLGSQNALRRQDEQDAEQKRRNDQLFELAKQRLAIERARAPFEQRALEQGVEKSDIELKRLRGEAGASDTTVPDLYASEASSLLQGTSEHDAGAVQQIRKNIEIRQGLLRHYGEEEPDQARRDALKRQKAQEFLALTQNEVAPIKRNRASSKIGRALDNGYLEAALPGSAAALQELRVGVDQGKVDPAQAELSLEKLRGSVTAHTTEMRQRGQTADRIDAMAQDLPAGAQDELAAVAEQVRANPDYKPTDGLREAFRITARAHGVEEKAAAAGGTAGKADVAERTLHTVIAALGKDADPDRIKEVFQTSMALLHPAAPEPRHPLRAPSMTAEGYPAVGVDAGPSAAQGGIEAPTTEQTPTNGIPFGSGKDVARPLDLLSPAEQTQVFDALKTKDEGKARKIIADSLARRGQNYPETPEGAPSARKPGPPPDTSIIAPVRIADEPKPTDKAPQSVPELQRIMEASNPEAARAAAAKKKKKKG